MAKISLRAYYREIEKLIDTGQTDEAIAHCRHILLTFPKHVGTYRLLGKAFLETQRYGDAADILQRVLSANPEDFISNLGMSIVREDEGNLDEAIWHMERAFEIQPANAAIQGELKRLYGRRDGLEPHKIHLTRGALARMYARGNLAQQAIAEIRATLAEDPQRPDLLSVLARMYVLAGQRAEAADTCQALLSKFPNCIEAIRILADILTETGRAEEAKPYRQRLQALEPYAAYLTAAMPSVDQVPESTVTLDRLDWSPEHPVGVTGDQPEWASSLGVKIEEFSTKEEALPEWLNQTEEAEMVAAEPEPSLESDNLPSWVMEEQAPEQAARPIEDDIPDWMKSAGWVPSSGEGKEEASVFFPEESTSRQALPDEPLAQAEIPDWLSAIAPEAAGEEAQLSQMLSSTAAWQDIEATVDESFQPGEGKPAALPEWLAELGAPAAGPITSEMAEPASAGLPAEDLLASATADELPEWLHDLGSPTTPETPEVGEPVSPLEEMVAEHAEEPTAEIPPEEQISEASEVVGWQYEETGPTEIPSTEAAAEPFVEIPPHMTGQGMLNWLNKPEPSPEMPPIETEEPKPLPILPEDFSPALPFVSPIEEAPVESSLAPEMAESGWPDTDKYVPEWMSAASQEELSNITTPPPEPSEVSETQLPDWLAEALGGAETATGLGGADLFEPPEWLVEAEQLESITAEETHLSVEPEVALPGAPALEPAISEMPEQDENLVTQEEDSFAWLESLAARQGAQEEELLTQPEDRPSEVPVWLRDLSSEAGEEPFAALEEKEPELAESVELAATQLPDWLSTSQPTDEILAEDSLHMAQADLPAWLQGAPSESSEQISDTQPVRIHRAAEEPPQVETTAKSAVDFEQTAPELPDISARTLSQDDETAAMAWLENLAARQGALEEDLLAEPEDHLEQIPGWVQEMAEAEPTSEEVVPGIAAQEAIPSETEAATLPTEMRETQEETFSSQVPLDLADEDATLAWLESLAARQGASEDELLTKPEERPELPPEWVQRAAAPEALELLTGPTEGLEIARPATGEGEAQPEPIEQISVIEEQPVDLFTEPKIEAELVSESQAEAVRDEIAEAISEPAEIAQPELPDWLSSMAQAEQPEEEAWSPPEYAEPAMTQPDWVDGGLKPGLQTELPIEKINLNLASLAQLERLPGVGFILAQKIVTYRDTFGAFKSFEDLRRISGVDEATLVDLQQWVSIVTLSESMPTPVISEAEPVTEELIQARSALVSGKLDDSLKIYENYIKEERHLPAIIQDLRQAIVSHPREVAIYQSLGDAYVRNNQLQEALEVYMQAEEILE
jgi:competence ComEA-like helix-hairpin-helix protein